MTVEDMRVPMRVEELLRRYRMSRPKPYGAEKIRFDGVAGRDVYNIAAPLFDDGEWVIPGRVEARDSEQSETFFFVERDGVWRPREGAPVFALQDPFHTRINGELIFGGVLTYPHPERAGELAWRTVLFRGERVAELVPCFDGPDRMKDLRLVQLRDGAIGVFTRPQGEKGGRGKIGFVTVPGLEALTREAIESAPLIDGQFHDEEWGGANEIHLLRNGKLGVLGHIARFCADGKRHYYPISFVFDPEKRTYHDMKILAERANFVAGPFKRPDLENVVFSGGLIRRPDGTADLYAGTSDAEAQKIRIQDPFVMHES